MSTRKKVVVIRLKNRNFRIFVRAVFRQEPIVVQCAVCNDVVFPLRAVETDFFKTHLDHFQLWPAAKEAAVLIGPQALQTAIWKDSRKPID